MSGLSHLSYRDRLVNLDLQTFERLRLVYDSVFCYKILHGLCDVSVPIELSYSNTRGNNLKLAKHFCYDDVRKYFFNNRVVDAWNSLSNNVVLSPSVAIFKKTVHC